jgi:hypothetical protein
MTSIPRIIDYPSGRLLAVLDDVAAADAAIRALVAAGWREEQIERLAGENAAEALDGTGALHGRLARLRRAVQFSLMDQLPDLAWYEAAVREGRVVLSVAAPDADAGARAARVLMDAGGHFINRFGRFQTEEFARWRGPEPAVSNLLRR